MVQIMTILIFSITYSIRLNLSGTTLLLLAVTGIMLWIHLVIFTKIVLNHGKGYVKWWKRWIFFIRLENSIKIPEGILSDVQTSLDYFLSSADFQAIITESEMGIAYLSDHSPVHLTLIILIINLEEKESGILIIVYFMMQNIWTLSRIAFMKLSVKSKSMVVKIRLSLHLVLMTSYFGKSWRWWLGVKLFHIHLIRETKGWLI